METLVELSARLCGENDVMSGIDFVLEAVKASLGCERAMIATVNPSTSSLNGFAWSGIGIGDLRSPINTIVVPVREHLDVSMPLRVWNTMLKLFR
jgi:hypothetical protein